MNNESASDDFGRYEDDPQEEEKKESEKIQEKERKKEQGEIIYKETTGNSDDDEFDRVDIWLKLGWKYKIQFKLWMILNWFLF